MQEAQKQFEDLGLSIVGLSYDNQEILADFSRRHGITFPLLADSDSSSIEALGLVNPDGKGMTGGVALPGIIYVDQDGHIADTYFEDNYRERPTPGTVLAKFFPEPSEEAKSTSKTPYLLDQTGEVGIIGSEWEVRVTFALPEGWHLYAPGNENYRPLKLEMEPHPWFEFGEITYPTAESERIELLDETLSVYTGVARISVPVTVRTSEETKSLTGPEETTIRGTLQYQICTQETCFMPKEETVEWKAVVKPMDLERAPENSRHE